MKSFLLIFACVASAVAVCTGEDCPLLKLGRETLGNRFRCDYEYEPSVEGWLKFHDIPASWRDARLRCHLEGTTLASPLNYALLEAIQSTADQSSDSGSIYTGIHATFSKEDYFSVEGVPLSEIQHTWSPGEPDNHHDGESCLILKPDGSLADVDCRVPQPYVCYRTDDEDLQDYNYDCATHDLAYIYSNITGSCYKFHTVPRTWSRAFMTCAAEGGYLTIINGNDEAAVLQRVFAAYPPFSMVGEFRKDVAFVGFHDWGEHGEFLTINGQTLTDAGYDKFSPGEPANSAAGEYCGAMYRSALLSDVRCDEHYAFICEKSPSSLLCEDEYWRK